jgi:hypothetical protein
LLQDHALRQYTEISAMSEPDYRNVESLRVWLKRANMGAYCISGAGSDVWGDLYKPEDDISFDDRCRNFLKSIIGGNTSQNTKFDLVSTHPRQQEDGLTHWLLKEWTTFYHAYRSSRQRNGQKDVEKFQGRAEGQNSRTPGQLRVTTSTEFKSVL